MNLSIAISFIFQTGAAAAGSLSDHRIDMPTAEQLLRVLTLRDYNTRVVVLGTTVLGMACGTVGTFMLLRKRSLVSDAISHATLPGIGLAFIVMTTLGLDGKFLPVLLLAAALAAAAGVACVLAIRNLTRLKEDAALGIVLSVFFGLGVALLGVIQKMSKGNAAGIESFIYGKTASMLWLDAALIGATATLALLITVALFKEFSLVCFDQAFASAQGWPVLWLDVAMMALVVVVTVVGLQAVGLILVVALLIIPPAAARFWTDRLGRLLMISAAIGGASGLLGAALSALIAKLPAGAIIVVVAAGFFAASLLFGARSGVVRRVLERSWLRRRVGRQHLLRAMYEWCEPKLKAGTAKLDAVPWRHLLAERSWSARQLDRQLRSAQRDAFVVRLDTNQWRLTQSGLAEAARVTKNHRLWEIYLITHADIAPSHVDRDADAVEHVLGRPLVDRLETLLKAGMPAAPGAPAVPASPHLMGDVR